MTRVTEDVTEQANTDYRITCITDHSGFNPVCLNKHTLRTAYYAYRQLYGERNDSENE